VESGAAATIVLHIPVVEKDYGEPLEAIRIECGNRRSRDAYFFEIALP